MSPDLTTVPSQSFGVTELMSYRADVLKVTRENSSSYSYPLSEEIYGLVERFITKDLWL